MDSEHDSNIVSGDHEDQPPVNKKMKKTPVPRKPACQPCRRRKVRCDNSQPACGFCSANGTECVYPTRGDDGTKQDLGKVLERLDTLSQTVENIQHFLTSQHHPQPTAQPHEEPESRSVSIPVRAADWQRDYLQIPASRCSADTVLTWPIFGGRFRESFLITTLFQYTHGVAGDRAADAWAVPDGLRFTPDDQIPTLVDQFIQNVHTKNPILDLESLIRSGRHAAEVGLQWDAQSCLVLLACALGCISQPFTLSTQGHQNGSPFPDLSEQNVDNRKSTSATQLGEGEAFFTLACRRIGLLRYSVIGAQCHFFAGAWNHFYQASTFYRLRLRLIDGLDKSAYEHEAEQQEASVARRLEQSLYWSCFKSEVEIRVELPLPQSAIAEYEYPALFPTPPTLPDKYPNGEDDPSGGTSSGTAPWSLDGERSNIPPRGIYNHITNLFDEQQSWYYYLTEVALRRIGNRVLNAFYREEPSAWSNIKPFIAIAFEFESQINSWLANLPPTMRFYESDVRFGGARRGSATDLGESISLELSWAVSNRFLEIRLWLYQPFLYFAVHRMSTNTGSSSLTNDEFNLVQGFVDSGLNCCMKILQARCLRHRHHGIWFDLRAVVTASLVFIALARSGNLSLPNIHPDGLRSHLAPTLDALHYWEDEAPDIKKARETLYDLLREFD
ncbi:unnamed protein product [Penicillium olsonii]|nr:unnamed protein product [Penicillium olsonii]